MPSAVNIDLNGIWLKTQIEPLDAFADGIFKELKDGTKEIGYSTSLARMHISKEEISDTQKKCIT